MTGEGVGLGGVRVCAVDGCGQKTQPTNRICPKHRYRMQKYGSFDAPPPRWKSGAERLWAKVDKSGACWLWTGYRPAHGYGTISVDGQFWRVHRLAWTLLRGPLSDNEVLDHLCRVHHCVNPDHLQPVDVRTNTLRGVGATAINARKTHCIRGHELAGANLRITKAGERRCRECLRLWAGNKRRSRRAA